MKRRWSWFGPPSATDILIVHLNRSLPPGQARVAVTLIDGDPSARTYREVAALLGLHVGPVHRQLGRLRGRHPALYEKLMAIRRRQLDRRRARALERRRVRSLQWGRLRYARAYRSEHGVWPWDRFEAG
jgi:hypothetical protein